MRSHLEASIQIANDIDKNLLDLYGKFKTFKKEPDTDGILKLIKNYETGLFALEQSGDPLKPVPLPEEFNRMLIEGKTKKDYYKLIEDRALYFNQKGRGVQRGLSAIETFLHVEEQKGDDFDF